MDGRELFEARVDIIVDTLIGEGKPWAVIMPIRWGYLKPASELEEEHFAHRAKSKVVIEYNNNCKAVYSEE